MTGWVTSREACERLGVRPQTLYAYVSRGRLTPKRDGRRSLFDVAQLDELASSGRRRARSGRFDVLIDTELTLLDPAGGLFYRGVDVTEVATRWSYERAAEWLWSSSDGEPVTWTAPRSWSTVARSVAGVRPSDRLRVAAATLDLRADHSFESLTSTGRALVAALVEALPLVGHRPIGRIAGIDRADAIAARLWPRLTALAPTPERLAVLNAAMVLLADHELAVSAMAARVAASVDASPVACVLAGLAAHGGGWHGAMTSTAHAALRRGDDVSALFGHVVYEGDDPRCATLQALLADVLAPTRWRPLARSLASGEHPSADLVLGAMAVGFDMVEGAAEAVFALARVAGWLAHAAEERERPLRFRARASYVGPPPLR